MKTRLLTTILFLFCITINLTAQLTPQEAVNQMARGINIGNTMEAPVEGTWGNPVLQERAFDDYKSAGFTAIRIPITWQGHTSDTPPYTITQEWLDRVEQVVDWGLARKLLIIINAHHEGFIKDSYTDSNVARFDSIWSQISNRMKAKSDSLIFEIINEPNPMTQQHVDELNARILKIIRKTNPTRIVVFSGNSYSNSNELIAAAVPDANDHYLIGYYHSYDPYPFGLVGPGTYGSDASIAATTAKFDQVSNWSVQKGIPAILGEFGYMKGCEYNSRMCAYATVVEEGLKHGIPTFAWDDNGDFPIYNRITGGFNEIKDVLIYTHQESPNKMKISIYADTLIQIQWNNRTTANDSIIVERKVDQGNFTFLAKIASTASSFNDSTTSRGKAYYYRLKTNLNGMEIQSYPVMKRIFLTRAPYLGTPTIIPGTVEAENYDIGGDGLTYHTFIGTNLEGMYRPNDGVDIGQQASGQYHIGYIATYDWFEYTVNIQQAGDYNITAYVASDGSKAGQFILKFGLKYSSFTTASTGGWSTYSTVSNILKNLKAGQQVMRLEVNNAGFYLDKITFSPVTAVNSQDMPTRFELFDNYPNPFNPSTTIAFNLPSRSLVTLKIYDLLGREVATLVSEVLDGGKYIRQWNSKNVASGVYFYRIQAGDFVQTKKLLLMK